MKDNNQTNNRQTIHQPQNPTNSQSIFFQKPSETEPNQFLQALAACLVTPASTLTEF
jgi:hypothetical protein